QGGARPDVCLLQHRSCDGPHLRVVRGDERAGEGAVRPVARTAAGPRDAQERAAGDRQHGSPELPRRRRAGLQSDPGIQGLRRPHAPHERRSLRARPGAGPEAERDRDGVVCVAGGDHHRAHPAPAAASVSPSVAGRLRRFLRADAMVAAGILISRAAGVVRTSAISFFFGLKSEEVDAFNAAFRIPNLLQNLFGEGALSGSFIPVYTGLRVRAEDESAAQTARTFFVLLSAVVALLVLVGMLAAPWITPLLVPGFTGHKR